MNELLTRELQYLISVSTADVVIIAKFDDQRKRFLCFISSKYETYALSFSSLDHVFILLSILDEYSRLRLILFIITLLSDSRSRSQP